MLSSSIVLATALASISAGLVNAQATSASARASTSEPSAAISSNTATAPSSTYSESDVPTGTPLPGNYAGPLRPQVHFSPPVGFMNDPNGMFVDQDGLYHLYYQYNPTAEVAGNQHWGHATSEDLYTWINQQIAIYPGATGEGIFSGSAVIDVNNTSGFFPNQTNGVVAIYTLNTAEKQTQEIAFSYDNGYSFIKYSGNPVIDSTTTQFRDPKVIWFASTEKWIMAVAYPVDFKIGIFSSSNLRNWTAESNFTHYGITGLQYECPNMVELPVVSQNSSLPSTLWVMQISINPGAPLGGSITEYFPGTFNGSHFEAVDSITRLTDFAKDNYAGQFFYNIPSDQDQVSINWASNWQYTNIVPTAQEGFRSTMSVPRGHYIADLERVGLSLISYPYNITSVVDKELASNSSLGNGTVVVDYSGVDSGALYFEANITNLGDSSSLSGTLNFTFLSSATGEYVSGGTFISSGDVWLNRGHTGALSENPYFTDKFSQTALYDAASGSWNISGTIDRSIIEVFVNGGVLGATSVFFPTQPLDLMILRANAINESATVSVGVWSLKAAWLDQANSNGTVFGNTTTVANGTNVPHCVANHTMSRTTFQIFKLNATSNADKLQYLR